MHSDAPDTHAPSCSRRRCGSLRPVKPKTVIALFPFTSVEKGDLELIKDHEYEVVEETEENWWTVRDMDGKTGLVPRVYLKNRKHKLLNCQWFVGVLSRSDAIAVLKEEDKEGYFLVRYSSRDKSKYILSLFTNNPEPRVNHYNVKKGKKGYYFFFEKYSCPSLPALINFHRYRRGGLATKLEVYPRDSPKNRLRILKRRRIRNARQMAAAASATSEEWEVTPTELNYQEELFRACSVKTPEGVDLEDTKSQNPPKSPKSPS